MDLLWMQERALSITRLHAGAMDQVEMVHAEFGALPQDAAQHCGPWQGQYKLEVVARWSWLAQLHIELYTAVADGLNHGQTAVTAQQPTRTVSPTADLRSWRL
jgi:hypothetical protein